jgi:hypothetical protein
MTAEEQAELEQLRKSARLFMTDPLEQAFFRLQSIIDSPHSRRLDSVLPTNSFHVLAQCMLELKRKIDGQS